VGTLRLSFTSGSTFLTCPNEPLLARANGYLSLKFHNFVQSELGMNEHLKLFQRIATSVELLTVSEASSLEIQRSAIHLGQTIQPCFEELQRSATKFQNLLKPCFTQLENAEAEWQAKPGIANAAAIELYEHLGHLSGYLFKLRLLKSQLTSQVLKEIEQYRQERVDFWKNKWFIDTKNGNIKSINLSEKEKFIQLLRDEFQWLPQGLDQIVAKSLAPMSEQLQQLDLDRITDHIKLLDNQQQVIHEKLLKGLNLSALQQIIERPSVYSLDGSQVLFTVEPFIDRLVDRGFLVGNLPGKAKIKSLIGHGVLPINWEHFLVFSEEVQTAIKRIITSVLEDRINLVITLLEQSIQFYDCFLEKHQRYQQETPEQRKSEQNWLVGCRQDLEKIQRDAETVLTSHISRF